MKIKMIITATPTCLYSWNTNTTLIYYKCLSEIPAVTCKSSWTEDFIWVQHLKIHNSGAKQMQWICMRAEHDTKPCGQDGPHPLVPAYGSSLSHHVQISFLWLSGTPPPSLPSICSSCQLSNAFESGKDTHTRLLSQRCQGRQIVPLLPTCQETKWQLGWRKKSQHLPCCLHDQSWSCLASECSASENPPLSHPLCAQRISDRVWVGGEFTRSLTTAPF